MTTPATALLNLLGFITGSALYAMLLAMMASKTPAARTAVADHWLYRTSCPILRTQ
jgi:hypothetical protein